MSQAELSPAQAHDAEHAHHEHPEWMAHHFDTADQQNTSAKMGMWAFLGTEILMFGGLFCAYSVWRATHFDAFWIGHMYLSTFWGAVNTCVLIISSFTMAWAVRAAQLNQRQLCSVLLALTFLGGVGFMCIKGYEYETKFHHGLGPGAWYSAPARDQELMNEAKARAEAAAAAKPAAAEAPAAKPVVPETTIIPSVAAPQGLAANLEGASLAETAAAAHMHAEASAEPAAAGGEENPYAEFGHTPDDLVTARPFFVIYFAMTALHGLHVLVGMALIAWIFIRNRRGDFSSEYNTPVDLVGLYWHLVDLIWIFLFPLLYLI